MNKKTSTNLIIDTDKEIGFTFQGDIDGVKHSIFDILVCRNQSEHGISLYDLNNLNNTGKIRIFFSSGNGEHLEEIKISDSLSNKVSSYLQENQLDAGKDIDCLGFCKKLSGIQEGEDLIQLKETEIQSGDILFLENKDIGGHHFAVYLGQGYYISRLGYGGLITFGTLEQLKNIYSPTRIYFLQNPTADTSTSPEEFLYPLLKS